MNNTSVILGIYVANRSAGAAEVQRVLTEYGCSIKTRIGLHETDEQSCSPSGLIILELLGGEETATAITAKLDALDGVQTQTMLFNR